MTQAEQRRAAKEFSDYWKDKGYEKGQSQPFWMSLLGDVLGVKHPAQVIEFEDQVKMEHTSFIDGYIPSTKVLIEQKSLGKDLDAPIKQSDGSLLTPFQQAKRYVTELPLSRHPRWIVTSNFEEFRVYDMERPNDPAEVVRLDDLENESHRLQFLVDEGSIHIRREMEISIEAGDIVGRIYDALKKEYKSPDSLESMHALNVLCVRLVFCLYAENAGLLGSYGMFGDYLSAHKDGARDALIKLFAVLDQTEDERDPYLDDDLAVFPYVNGGLFRQQIEIPRITPEIVDLILHKASEGFNWRDISPTIFGAIFESTLNPQTRRAGGMHYTSVENIHKVIDPLFLDDLRSDLEKAQGWKQESRRRKELQAFRDRLASLRFFDPACGSGNFLTETYLSLRRMENEAIRTMTHGQIGWDVANPIQVSIGQFYGIEINDFAVTVAQTALWIAEAQMLQETETVLNMQIDYLPLTTSAHIHEGNALRMDWNDVLTADECSYVMGNPPFSGARIMKGQQKKDVLDTFGAQWKNAGNLDYVACWFKRTADYMKGTRIRAALVATNSICQGESVSVLWAPLFTEGVHIDFAWTTFRWDSEAKSKAHVHVVIVGFSDVPNAKPPMLYMSDRDAGKEVANINGYLTAGPNVSVNRNMKPLCDVPQIALGSQPIDDGGLVMTREQANELCSQDPLATKFLRSYMMGEDFIKRKPRCCLWLDGASPSDLKKCPHVLERVEHVKAFRKASKRSSTLRAAEKPTLFAFILEPKTKYIAIPKVSSERRRYIPIDYLEPEVIPGDKLFVMQKADLYHFGILTSNVHMAWMRIVAGRMKSDYSYSNTLVYNNFPWPDPTPKQKARIEKTAQAILDARALYPDSTLADLYDETTMPPELRTAHQNNDRAVMDAYGFRENGHWLSEPETVARLMQMYADLTQTD